VIRETAQETVPSGAPETPRMSFAARVGSTRVRLAPGNAGTSRPTSPPADANGEAVSVTYLARRGELRSTHALVLVSQSPRAYKCIGG